MMKINALKLLAYGPFTMIMINDKKLLFTV